MSKNINSCGSCVNDSLGRKKKNFMQCTETKKDNNGMPLSTEKKCVPVLVNDMNKYYYSAKEAPFRVQFPDEDSCKKAILLPGIGIDCETAKTRLKQTRQYQDGEVENCFDCKASDYLNSTVENYDYGSKKNTYLSLGNCWQNQNRFDL